MKNNFPKFLSIHNPKTAGTTFLVMLRNYYGNKFHLQTGNVKPASPGRYDVIHGHFSIDFFNELKRPAICFVRHPVERVISHYYFWLQYPDRHNPLCMKMINNKWSLSDFAKCPDRMNVMSQFMGPDLDRFAFIGIQEDFENSVMRFEELFEIKLPRIQSRRVTMNKPEVSKEIRAMILAKNLQDMKIFQHAVTNHVEWLESKLLVSAHASLVKQFPWCYQNV
jgi:hypothetical protein